jgi:hypothetical protein
MGLVFIRHFLFLLRFADKEERVLILTWSRNYYEVLIEQGSKRSLWLPHGAALNKYERCIKSATG